MTEQVICKTMMPTTSDEVLLHQYVHEQSQQAFSHLVKRHAPLVWSVCRRIIHHHQSAEDAFQATFVVLMKQAPKLTLRASLSTWLYAVAVRIARRTQSRDSRLTTTSSHVNELAAKPASQLTVQELIEVVKQEVSKLPSRYQPVMDLCFFQRLSVREASERLSQPYGAVRGCLQRGKKLLQERLAKRGIAPLALATLTASSLQAQPIPTELLTATEFMNQGQVPDRLLQLGAMPMVPVRSLVVSMALVTLLIAGVGFGLMQLQASPPVAVNFSVISVLDPVKPASKVCGYVDDHEGKPVPHAKVEVYHLSKLMTVLTCDAVGRFDIPVEWKRSKDDTSTRFLLVRQNNSIGWSDRLSWGSMPQRDIVIQMLPLEAEVSVRAKDQEGKVLPASLSKVNGAVYHPINGSYTPHYIGSSCDFFPSSRDQTQRLTVKVPIHTKGMFFVSSVDNIDTRLHYIAQGKGQYDAGEMTLAAAGSITGIVTDPQGKPMEDVHIIAQQNNTRQLHYMDGTWSECRTDKQGRYLLTGLNPKMLFNVMQMRAHERPGQKPLLMHAVEAVEVVYQKPTTLNLNLVPAILVKGIVLNERTSKPVKEMYINYRGSVRPDSSACVLGSTSGEDGRFSMLLPAGPARFCCAQTGCSEVKTTIVEGAVHPEITLQCSDTVQPHGYLGERCFAACSTFTEDPTKVVQAFLIDGATSVQHQYDQLIEFENTETLPPKLSCKLYQKGKAVVDRGFVNRLQGELQIENKQCYVTIPALNDENLIVELDAEGFEPLRHEFPAKQIKGPFKFKLIPSTYQKLACNIQSANQQPAAQARVQVELQRLGTVVDSPWGPILLTDDAGKCTIEHLRPSDIFRLRVWGQDGSSAVTDWQQIKDAKTINVQLK